MEVFKNLSEYSYVMDIVKTTGEIIITFTANIRGDWAMSSCIMDHAAVNQNIDFINEKYGIFEQEAKTIARSNNVIVF